MITQMYRHSCTIYLKQGEAQFSRHPVEGVHWEDTKGVNFNRTGVQGVDKVSVSIPLEKTDLDGWGTDAAGYIVRGIWMDEVTDADSLKAFLAKKPHAITSIAKHDYALVIGDHWKVGAK